MISFGNIVGACVLQMFELFVFSLEGVFVDSWQWLLFGGVLEMVIGEIVVVIYDEVGIYSIILIGVNVFGVDIFIFIDIIQFDEVFVVGFDYEM